MIDRKTIFDQPVKNDERKYNHIRKLKMVKDIIIQLLICSIILFEMKAIDLDKQQEADADTKAKKKKKKKKELTGNLDRAGNITMFFVIEELEKIILYFWQKTVTALEIYLALMEYQYKITQYNSLNVKLLNSHQIIIKYSWRIGW